MDCDKKSQHGLSDDDDYFCRSMDAISREINKTEARKLIRMETHEILEKRKEQKLFDREIDKFKTRLEHGRMLNKIAQKTTREVKSPTYIIQKISKNAPGKENHGKIVVLQNAKHYHIVTNHNERKDGTKTTNNNIETSKKDNIGSLIEISKTSNDRRAGNHSGVTRNSKQNVACANTKPSANTTIINKQSCKRKPPKKYKAKAIETRGTAGKNGHFDDVINILTIRKTVFYYWSRWKLYVKSKKKKREEEKNWRERIHLFMQKFNERPAIIKGDPPLTKEPATTQVRHSPFRMTRKKVLQTPNIKEKVNNNGKKSFQNRDLDTIAKSITKSVSSVKKTVISKTATSVNSHLNGKVKLIRQFISIPKTSHENRQMEFPRPEILFAMDQKHIERKQRLIELQERRRVTDEEKDRLAKEKYEQHLHQIEMEKKTKLQAFRKKLQCERVKQEKQRAELLRLKQLEEISNKFHDRKLLWQYGFYPWRCLTLQRRLQVKKAELHDSYRITRSAFSIWKGVIEEIKNKKIARVISVRHRQLLKWSFVTWKGVVTTKHIQWQVAEDWYDYKLLFNSMSTWRANVVRQQVEFQEQWEAALTHYRNKLLTACVKHWMLLPQILCLERAKELRKNEWRDKVQQVLPDFMPKKQNQVLWPVIEYSKV